MTGSTSLSAINTSVCQECQFMVFITIKLYAIAVPANYTIKNVDKHAYLKTVLHIRGSMLSQHALASCSRNKVPQNAPSCVPGQGKIVAQQKLCSLIMLADIKLVKCEGASTGSKLLHATGS